jgi:hypothetical protein
MTPSEWDLLWRLVIQDLAAFQKKWDVITIDAFLNVTD